MESIDDLLAQAKLPERAVQVCLRGDLVAEHEELNRQLELLLEVPAVKLGGDGRYELAARVRDLEERMQSATREFRFRAMPRTVWGLFVDEHPPRPDVERDVAVGVNTATFYEALVRRCLIDPVLTDVQWRTMLGDSDDIRAKLTADGKADEVADGVLTDRQFGAMSDAAWALNRRDIDVPFSSAAWGPTGNS